MMWPLKGFNIECYYLLFDKLVVVGAQIINSCLGTSNPYLPSDERMNDSLHRRKSLCGGNFMLCLGVRAVRTHRLSYHATRSDGLKGNRNKYYMNSKHLA